MLDFELPQLAFEMKRAPSNFLRVPWKACRCFPTFGGGSQSQAPDIRCLVFGSPPTLPDLREELLDIPRSPPEARTDARPPAAFPKPSPGYPLLNFGNRSRGFGNACRLS